MLNDKRPRITYRATQVGTSVHVTTYRGWRTDEHRVFTLRGFRRWAVSAAVVRLPVAPLAAGKCPCGLDPGQRRKGV